MNCHRHFPSRPSAGPLACWIAMGIVGAGCISGGGQTGGENTGGASGSYGIPCETSIETFALDAVTPLGVSAGSLLAPLVGTHRSSLLWNAFTEPVVLTPDGGESSIELTLDYTGGSVSWVRSTPTPAASSESGAGAAPAVCPPDHLEIRVSVQVRTADDALDEEFGGTLTASSADAVQLAAELPLAALSGSLEALAPLGTTVFALEVNAAWDALGFHGTLLGQVQYDEDDGSISFGQVAFAKWPWPRASQP